MLNQPPLFVRRWLSCDAKKDEISQFCHQKSVRTEPQGGRSLLSFTRSPLPFLIYFSTELLSVICDSERRKSPFYISSPWTYSCRFPKWALSKIALCLQLNRDYAYPLLKIGLYFIQHLSCVILYLKKGKRNKPSTDVSLHVVCSAQAEHLFTENKVDTRIEVSRFASSDYF